MSRDKATVLVVDDDPSVGTVLTALLRQDGLEAFHDSCGEDALKRIESSVVDLVITDLKMPTMDGIQLLGHIKAEWPEIPVIMLTAHGTVATAVQAMKGGAADFLLKPFEREEVLYTVHKCLSSTRYLREQPPPRAVLPGTMIGRSDVMLQLGNLLRRAAGSQATVLLTGESGTGKELAARAIHEQSPRSDQPFVAVHCAALPENLLESELFGYEKGAFTGAMARKPGRVELAQGGTLFLDEIGDLSMAMQVKLLRLLQEKEFQRLGGTQTCKADVRFVAATNRDLEGMVKDDQFREDLYYRLSVIPIQLPPLRHRLDDINLLAQHFSGALAEQNGLPPMSLEDRALDLLSQQPWPGNVRQLQNFMERLIVLCDGPTITHQDVIRELERQPVLLQSIPVAEDDPKSLKSRRDQAERKAVLDALKRANQNRTVAARILGVSRRTLYNKLDELGIGSA